MNLRTCNSSNTGNIVVTNFMLYQYFLLFKDYIDVICGDYGLGIFNSLQIQISSVSSVDYFVGHLQLDQCKWMNLRFRDEIIS